MPKILITEESRISDAFYRDLAWILKKHGIRQKHLASVLGISQPAVSKKLKTQSLTTSDLIAISLLTGETLCIHSD